MGQIYLNDDDYFRIRENAKKVGISLAEALKREIHKKPEEVTRHYIMKKLAGEKAKNWPECNS